MLEEDNGDGITIFGLRARQDVASKIWFHFLALFHRKGGYYYWLG